VAKYEVTVVVGKRQTFVVEAADEAEAREQCERGDKPSAKKYVHDKDEVVVVTEPKLAEVGLGSRVVKGLWNMLRRPCKSQEEPQKRASGESSETTPPDSSETS
jgi:hypothetical protein